eukprot:CAMPEP_0172460322 /NCGR_PEP_ID=MMETSP1065-20121228/36458_1 /TAXON_ID=265537 /ORGANISM="Amphiprora paludosa, Strain CCMP125" /LENGTH=293 /DNA_ID=CAMNT_0013215315 /DNA_START=18 /DNA_END=899 /DNA_ORIENTATION=-
MTQENQVRRAGEKCLEYWCQDHEGTAELPASIHQHCLVTCLVQNQEFATIPGKDLRLQQHYALGANTTVTITAVKVLPVGPQTTATVQFELSTTTTGGGFLTLLQSQTHGWTCISAVVTDQAQDPILPLHFEQVLQLTWNGYCGANRACRGDNMAQVFHPHCRLTYAFETDVAVISQSTFCQSKVTERYTNMNLPHHVYAKLQHHPDLGKYDRIEALEFVGPRLCMVTLRVAHPPCLWTDVLTCAYLGDVTDHDDDEKSKNSTKTGWWIMHKSSCYVEYELTEDMKAVLLSEE